MGLEHIEQVRLYLLLTAFPFPQTRPNLPTLTSHAAERWCAVSPRQFRKDYWDYELMLQTKVHCKTAFTVNAAGLQGITSGIPGNPSLV